MGIKKDILFVSVDSHIPESTFYSMIGQQLVQQGYSVAIVTLSQQEILQYKDISVCWIGDWLPDINSPDLIQEETRILAVYDLPSLKWLWLSDRGIYRHSPQVMRRKAIAYFLAWEQIIGEMAPDYIFSDFGGELMRRVPYRVAQLQGKTYIYMDWSPIRGLFALHTSELNHWSHMRIESFPLSDAEQEIVDHYLDTTRRQNLSAVRFWTPQVTGNRIQRLFRELHRERVIEKGEHDHFTPTRWFKQYLARMMRIPFAKRFYSKPQENEKYLFFPLHVPDDAQIPVRAPLFLQQDALVDWIARSLPDGYMLYVKEHPNFIGKYPLSFYRRIAKTDRVRFVPPYVHPHLLIKQSQAVVTINSTAGFESLLYHKPVIVLGHASYWGYGATIDVSNINDLPFKIKEALTTPPPVWKIDRLIWSMMQASYPGRLYDFSEENLAKVADSMHKKIQETG